MSSASRGTEVKAIGKTIHSDKFSVGGHDWSFCFTTRSYSSNARIYLVYEGPNTEVKASYELRLLDLDNGPPLMVYKKAPRVFTANGNTMFDLCVIKHSQFEASPYLQDDCLTIECTVTVIKEPRLTETKPFPRIEVPPSDITLHFGKLLETEEGVDVTFSVGGQNLSL
ncbi:hypothetical protein BAE44_0001988 [Dichanthelium oligosanthes]|uniref:MATH domain-containing protein n=1 Tax=Dichanthelium oligosanthes TaxID=888268 RepID=A0A1E5WHW3_9POAL|nr:hypothetical protein BAE44_0001988 [Dichanthelium oligosanthes]